MENTETALDVPKADGGAADDDGQESALIWAIRYLEVDAVEEMLAEGASAHRADTPRARAPRPPTHPLPCAAGHTPRARVRRCAQA